MVRLVRPGSETAVGQRQLKCLVPDLAGDIDSAVDCVSDVHLYWETETGS